MQVKFLQAAQYELDAAVAYYNDQAPNLGHKFLIEILASLSRVCQYPNAWHPITDKTRRCQLRRFPYGVIYTKIDDVILVIAIGHLHRKPEYWQALQSRFFK